MVQLIKNLFFCVVSIPAAFCLESREVVRKRSYNLTTTTATTMYLFKEI